MVCYRKRPLACTPVALNLLDGLVGVDLAFRIVWARFVVMPRFFMRIGLRKSLRFSDDGFHCSWCHGPVHIRVVSAADLGFVWSGAQQGWIRSDRPLVRMMSGPSQHLQSAIIDAW